jgi:hypothetical protein
MPSTEVGLQVFADVVSGAYAKPIFHDMLGAEESTLHNCVPKPVAFVEGSDA